MVKVEDLSGIHGTFQGEVKAHPQGFRMRGVVDGTITYKRDGEGEVVVINVQGLRAKRVPDDNRRFVRAERGPKGNRDKIIGLIDKDGDSL